MSNIVVVENDKDGKVGFTKNELQKLALGLHDWIRGTSVTDIPRMTITFCTDALLELLKEQETANLYKCPNCGTWVSAENVVRCKDCRYGKLMFGNVICHKPEMKEYEKDVHPVEWFCADGERA